MILPSFIHQWNDVRGRAVRGRPLWVNEDGSVLLGRDDGSIEHFDPVSKVLRTAVSSPYGQGRRALAFSRLAARLLRMGPRAFVKLPSGTLVWVAGGQLWRCSTDNCIPVSTHRFEYGSGPLFLAQMPDHSIVFGDYVANQMKVPSTIRRSIDDGRSWHKVYEFPASRIRHVHGAFWDPYAGRICLTTGDSNYEAGIWSLEGDVPHLMAGGSSLFRVVQPVFTKDAILFGTDTPGEDCGIYRMSRQDGQIEFLQHTRGPVFFGTGAADRIAFTTVVEPGHPERAAALYVGSPNGAFKEVLALGKDIWGMRLFQYGQIHLPANSSPAVRLWFAPCATEGDHRLCSLETQAESNHV